MRPLHIQHSLSAFKNPEGVPSGNPICHKVALILSVDVNIKVAVLPTVTVTVPVPTSSSFLYKVAVYVPGLTPVIEKDVPDTLPQYCAAVLSSPTTAEKPEGIPDTVPDTVPRPDAAT